MYLIEIHESFSAAHAVRLPDGIWETPHRHQWKLRIFLNRDDGLNDNHMVVDFVEAKKLLRSILDPMEGRNLNDISALGSMPTAEVVARYIFDRFTELLVPAGVRVKALALCEADDCWAWYTGESHS